MAEKKPEPRCWLYSKDCPQGQLFTGERNIKQAEAAGWADSPDSIGKKKKPEPAE